MGKSIRRIVSVAAPVVGSIFGGPLGGAAGGALGGAIGGGGLKGALTGAALGGVAGAAPNISGSLGLSGALGSGVTNAIRGAALGGITGGTKGALLGGVLGGAGGYITSGGNVPGLGSVGGELGAGGIGPPTPATGLLGSLTKGTGLASGGGASTVGGSLGGSGMNLSNVLRASAGIFGQAQEEDTNEEIRRALLQAQGQSQETLNPFRQTGVQANQQLSSSLAGGFNPEDLQNNPGYQFRLQQGQEALNRQLGASGLGQSGAALKAAQQYGQGLAAQEYGDAYTRWLQQNQQLAGLSGQGLGASSGIAGGYENIGGVNALTLSANQQSREKLMAALLGGGGLFG